MKLPTEEIHAIREKALLHCQEYIEWYEKMKRNRRRAHYFLQAGVIVLSGLTPILILSDQVSKPLQALPAALAGILAAITGVFQISESFARFAYTAEALKSEKLRFETRTTKDYQADVDEADADEYKALNKFVGRMEDLVMSEVTDWRQFVQGRDKQEGQ